MLAGAELLEKYASLNLKVFNKGISGNKVYQLAERWDTGAQLMAQAWLETIK